MKKFISLILAAGLALGTFTGCGGNSAAEETSSNSEAVVLRVGAQPYPLYSSIYVAHELGYLEEELEAVGAAYEWKEFKSGSLVNEAAAAGEVDMGFMADLPAIISRSTGQPVEIISNVAYGEKALAVLVRPDSDITSVAELEGKKVAYTTGSYTQHLIALLLANEGLSLDDIESINLAAGDQAAALTNGDVEAIVTWEQYVSQFISDGTAKLLADGTGVKKGNMITYFETDYAEAHPDVVKAYIRALNRAGEYIEENPDETAELAAETFGVDIDVMKTILSHLTFTTELTEDDIAEITKVKDFSLEQGLISNDIDINSFINTEYVNAVNAE
ncbi:MAG: aliphatic sulfonate ABC transporter substrate-binding protein [Clostridiales bacterium]|nr:aliphatic sulfonate ABC transporter substrate-binding protein [Clostridiales bacterium]